LIRALLVGCAITSSVFAQDPQSGARRLTMAPDRRVELDLQHYYTSAELKVALNALSTAYPELLRLESMGKSRGGDELWVMTVAKAGAVEPAKRPGVFVAGALGSHDLFGTELALATILDFAQNSARDTALQQLLERTTIYIAPCINPDLRARVFAQFEGTPAAPVEASAAVAEVDFERNFPIAWDPVQFSDAGPYPLSAPETRATVEFLLGRPNIAALQIFGAANVRGAAHAGAMPPGDSALHEQLAASLRVVDVGHIAAPEGNLLTFGYEQLGAFSFAFAPEWGASASSSASASELPAGDALLRAAPSASAVTARLGRSLARLEFGEVKVERLKGDQWQLRVVLANSGALPTQSARGVERFACAAPRVTVEGARIVDAALINGPRVDALAHPAASVTVPEIGAGSSLSLLLFVEAPAETTVKLGALAPRAGSAASEVVLR
jgi:hypothetical protein